jgi:hypothetical protein
MNTAFLRLYKVENLSNEIGNRFHVKLSGTAYSQDLHFSFGLSEGQSVEFNRYLYAYQVENFPLNLNTAIELSSSNLLPFTTNHGVSYMGNDNNTFTVEIIPSGYPPSSKVVLYFEYFSRVEFLTDDYYQGVFDISNCLRLMMLWTDSISNNATLSSGYDDLKSKLQTLIQKLNDIGLHYDFGAIVYKDSASFIQNFNAFLERLEKVSQHIIWVKDYNELSDFDTAYHDFISEFDTFKTSMNSNGINPCDTLTHNDVWGDLGEDFKSKLDCFCKLFALDGNVPNAIQTYLTTLKLQIDDIRSDLIDFHDDQKTASLSPVNENYLALDFYNQFSSGLAYCEKSNEVFELMEWLNKNRQGFIDLLPDTVDQFINSLSTKVRNMMATLMELEFALPGICEEPDFEGVVQSPYLYIQACGSDSSDPYTEGIHLRWSLLKQIGEHHLPKGDLANNGNTYYADYGFTKDDDYVELLKTPYTDRAIINLDLSITNPKFEQFIPFSNSYSWTFPVASTTQTSSRSFTNDVIFTFKNKAIYDTVRSTFNPTTNALDFIKAYTEDVEVSVFEKLMFAYHFEVNNQTFGNMGNLFHEVINLPDPTDEATKRITRRKTTNGETFDVEEVGENILFLRFKTDGGAYLNKIHLETYTDFLKTRVEADWSDLGDFALTTSDAVAYTRLDDSGSWNIDNNWPKFNDDITVKIDNYEDKWADVDAGLKKSVEEYLDLSTTDTKAEYVFESNDEGDSSKMPFSYLDILQLNSLDFHNARMLGLGHIDTASISQKYVYLVRYETNPLLMVNRAIAFEKHHFMSLPTDKSDLRLPLKPDADVSYGLSGNDECSLGKIQNENGYAKYDAIRFVNVHREKYDYEVDFEGFFEHTDEFDIAELALPVFYGVKYRALGSSYQKPDLSNDEEYQDYNGSGTPSEVNEVSPLLDTGDKLYTHFESNAGIHEYGIYGINWFSRASAVSDPAATDDTQFEILATLLPPENILAHYVQEESTLIFTTESEQIALEGRNTSNPGADNCQVRLNFNWGYKQHFSYPDCSKLEIFFREELPMFIEGKINKIESIGQGVFKMYSESYQIVSKNEIETIEPTLSGSDYPKFIGGKMISDGGVFTIESIVSGSLGPVIQFKAENSSSSSINDNGSSVEGFCVPIVPKVGQIFQLIENLANDANWQKLTRTITIVKHSNDTVEIDGINREYGGIKDDVNVYQETFPGDSDPIAGLFKIEFTTETLANHPQDSEGVHWNKGNLLLKDQNNVYRELEVWGIASQSPLIVWAYDSHYGQEEVYDYDFSDAMTSNNVTGVFHPGYKVYLSAEPSNGFDRDHILPVSGDYKKTSFIALRSIDDSESPVLESRISNAIPMVAYWKKAPVKPNAPIGPKFATRPDVYALSTYTFDIKMESEKPFSLMCYKTTELSLLSAVYETEVIKAIYDSISQLEDHSFEYNRFNDFVNGIFDEEDDINDKKQYKEYAGYRLPNTFNDFIETGDPEELVDRLMQAINLTFIGMTMNPIVYSKVKINNDTRLTLPSQPKIKKINGEDLLESDPEYNLYPNSIRFNDGTDDYIRFTDYKISGASSDKYFYMAAEVSIEQEIGERSLAIGPIRTINSMPAEAPYVRKYEAVLAYPSLEIPHGIRFYVNPYLESDEVEKIAIYRTTEEKFSDDVQKMTLAKTAMMNEGLEVVDTFDDLEFPPFGYDIYYRLVALRKIINEQDEVEYIPSKPSEKIICKVIDNVNPESPEITYTVEKIYTEPGRLENVTLDWEATCFEGKYTLYKMSDTGFWQKLKSYNYDDNFEFKMDYLNTEDNDGDVVYHRFKVIAENKNGLLSLDENIATLWQIPDWFKNMPLAKFEPNNVLAAYSSRKLMQAYTGSAMLTRNNSAVEMEIGFINEALDTDALLTHAASGNVTVVKFLDQSNNGNDLIQNTLADQPLIVESGTISEASYEKIGLKFNASTFDDLNTILNNINSDFSYYMVFDMTSVSGDFDIEIVDNSSSNVVASSSYDLDTFRNKVLLSLYYDSDEGKLKIKLPLWSTQLTYDPTTQSIRIKYNNSTDFTGYISEVILLAQNLEKNGIETDFELELKNHWNLYGTDSIYPFDYINKNDLAGGFSLRKLQGDFEGNVLETINDSSTILEIGLNGDDVSVTDVETHAGVGDVKVTKWLNQVDNDDLEFAQTDSSLRPYIAEGGSVNYTFSGKPGLKFYESDMSWMMTDFDLSNSDFTIYTVLDIQNGDGNLTINVYNSDTSQKVEEQIYDSTDYTRKLLIAMYYNDSSQTLTLRTQNYSKLFDFDPALNMISIYSDETCLFEGCISEFLVFKKDLRKLAKATTIENNIKTYWDIN